ncbi:MAG TPA: histidine ammonia-lyase [Casimicrobiaceae bacterium]|nr:histidine ammonia-lyase [Casimicrobiaceae bacterium]
MTTPDDSIELDGHGIRLAGVERAARHYANVTLSETARQRVADARAVVDRFATGSALVYGVNSALGANTGCPISPGEQGTYQLHAIRARAVGVGPPLATDVVRAMMFARAAGMAVGGSGVSTPVLDLLVDMLNARVHPRVPSIGSIGVADLPQLSHMALVLVGEGQAEYAGELLGGNEALSRSGLSPVTLGTKDGIALISSNAASVGHAALTVHDAATTLDLFNVAAALSFEGFRANLSVLDPRVHAARPAPGQSAIASRLADLLRDSELWQPGRARRVQDPLSFRCIPQVHGAALAALRNARDLIELELNCAADSPLVIAGDDAIVSNGNFHVPHLALSLDTLRIALTQVANLAVERCLRLLSDAASGLPLQLTRHGPNQSGFSTLQKTMTALYNDIRHHANPVSLDFLPVSESVEDHAPMTFGAVANTCDVVESLRYLAACELIVAAQAVDLRGTDPATLGAATRAAQATLRQSVAMLDDDRPLGPDIDRVVRDIVAGRYATIDLLASDV